MAIKPALGLYFTDQFVEISKVSSDGSKLSIFNQIPIPTGIIVNGEIKEAFSFQKILRQLITSTPFHQVKFGEKVVVGVAGNRIFLREFTVPKYPGKEIEDVIEYQIRQLLPLLPTGIETDWQIIGHNQEGEIEVLLAAIPKAVVQSYLNAVNGAGLQVVAIEPAVFANIRNIDPGQLKAKDQLLVYLGESYTEFTYLTNGHPRFSDYLHESEVQKKGGIENAIKEYAVFSNSKHPNRHISEIIISGHHPQVEPLVNNYQGRKIAAYVARNRVKSPTSNQASLHTSVGLSLKTQDSETTINLVPLSLRLDMISDRLIDRWKVVLRFLIFISLITTVVSYYLYNSAFLEEKQLKLIAGEYKRDMSTSDKQELINSADTINGLSDQLILLKKSTGGESQILNEIVTIIPKGLSLSSLVYSRGPGSVKLLDSNSNWSITGIATSRELIIDFFNKLITQPGFTKGRLYFGSLEKETSVTFRIANQAK